MDERLKDRVLDITKFAIFTYTLYLTNPARDVKNGFENSCIRKAMYQNHTWHRYFVNLPVYLTGGSSAFKPIKV